MIKKSDIHNIPHQVIEYLYKDPARNYFILLGIIDRKPVFKNLFLQYKGDILTSVLFQRNSGSLQFYSDSQAFESDEIKKLISSLDYTSLISPYSYSQHIYDRSLFSKYEKRGYICRLGSDALKSSSGSVTEYNGLDINKNTGIERDTKDLTLKPLDVSMLDGVEELYKEVFHAYASRSVMETRLSDKRGRGYVIYHDGRIISAVQSEFESRKSAVIVGVATSKDFQKKGLAGFLLELICKELAEEGKNLYLQFDNPDAGRIYYRFGFKDVDRVVHFFK